VTSSSAETPVSFKDEYEEDEEALCSPNDRVSPNTAENVGSKTNKSGSGDSPVKTNQLTRKSKSAKKTVEMKGRCNCDELLTVNCHLETKDLWDKFHDLGTEMIITKTGRYVLLFKLVLPFYACLKFGA